MAKPPKTGKRAPRKAHAAPGPAVNKRLTAQNRKLLGKHYANKYRTGRG